MRNYLFLSIFTLTLLIFSVNVMALNVSFNRISLDSGYKITSIASDGTYYYGIANNELTSHNRIYKFDVNGTVLNSVTDVARKSTGTLFFSDIEYSSTDNAMIISAYGSDGVDIHVVAVDSDLSLLTNFTGWSGSIPYYTLNLPAHLVPLEVSDSGYIYFAWPTTDSGDHIWKISKWSSSGVGGGDVNALTNPLRYESASTNFKDMIYNPTTNTIYFVAYETANFNSIYYSEWNETDTLSWGSQLRYVSIGTYDANAETGSICLGNNNEFYIVESMPTTTSYANMELYRVSRTGSLLNSLSVFYTNVSVYAVGCVYDTNDGKLYINDYFNPNSSVSGIPEINEYTNALSYVSSVDDSSKNESIMSNNLLKDNLKNFTMLGHINDTTPTSAFYQFQNGLAGTGAPNPTGNNSYLNFRIGVLSSTETNTSGCRYGLSGATVNLYNPSSVLIWMNTTDQILPDICTIGSDSYAQVGFTKETNINITEQYGTYLFTASKSGYNPANYYFNFTNPNQNLNLTGSIYLMPTNSTLATFSGVIYDSNNSNPITNAQICINFANSTQAHDKIYGYSCVYTSNVGEFNFNLDKNYYYYYTVSADNYITNSSNFYLTGNLFININLKGFTGNGTESWNAIFSTNNNTLTGLTSNPYTILLNGTSSPVPDFYFYDVNGDYQNITLIFPITTVNPYTFNYILAGCGSHDIWVLVAGKESNHLSLTVNQPCIDKQTNTTTSPTKSYPEILPFINDLVGILTKPIFLYPAMLLVVGFFVEKEFAGKLKGLAMISIFVIGITILSFLNILPRVIWIVELVIVAGVVAIYIRNKTSGH